MAVMQKCQNVKNINFHNCNFKYHISTNLPSKYMCSRVKIKMKLFLKIYSSLKGLKSKMASNFEHKIVSDTKSTVIPFFILL